MIVNNIFVGTHRHNCCLYLNFVKYLLLRNLHHSYRPAFIRVFTVKSLIDCAHCTLTKLFGKAIDLIGIVRQKVDFLNLFIKLAIRQKSIIWNFLLFLQPSHNLDHYLRIVLNNILTDIVLGEELHHLWSEPFNSTWTVKIDL